MADQQQPTQLWEAMRDAVREVAEQWKPSLAPASLIRAAMIKAIADWLVPEEPQPPFHCDWQRWHVRRQIRQRLLEEARRAREAS